MVRFGIYIALKPEVRERTGGSTTEALHALGFTGVQNKHEGRYIELDCKDGTTIRDVKRICREGRLANPVIETFEVKRLPKANTGRRS